MEWSVTTKATYRRGIEGIVIKPAEGQKPTREEWDAIRNIVEQAIKKASS